LCLSCRVHFFGKKKKAIKNTVPVIIATVIPMILMLVGGQIRPALSYIVAGLVLFLLLKLFDRDKKTQQSK
jgi:hypothetical protein